MNDQAIRDMEIIELIEQEQAVVDGLPLKHEEEPSIKGFLSEAVESQPWRFVGEPAMWLANGISNVQAFAAGREPNTDCYAPADRLACEVLVCAAQAYFESHPELRGAGMRDIARHFGIEVD